MLGDAENNNNCRQKMTTTSNPFYSWRAFLANYQKKKGFPHSRSWGQVHGCDHLVICLGWISAASLADNPSVSKFSLNEALWSDGCDNHNAKQTQITIQ